MEPICRQLSLDHPPPLSGCGLKQIALPPHCQVVRVDHGARTCAENIIHRVKKAPARQAQTALDIHREEEGGRRRRTSVRCSVYSCFISIRMSSELSRDVTGRTPMR